MLKRRSGNTDEDFNYHEEVFAMTYRQLPPRRDICSPPSEGKGSTRQS